MKNETFNNFSINCFEYLLKGFGNSVCFFSFVLIKFKCLALKLIKFVNTNEFKNNIIYL
jgi:hypothetical protein